ncbi:pyridoxamine 5'-phosphate oxidase family protein [bacterium]|nr:pyridoxamine 5'-phosphate oxidase family protein [bacterium]MBU1883303.1 pyridoxamine 5'-phosphate oxidase family protein [bacterium]
MNYEDILSFVQSQPVCTLATCSMSEENTPHVRGFLTNIIDQKIYFTTSANKNVGKQIVKNKHAELCYLSHDFSKMLRISTTLEILNDKKIKQHLIDTREYLKGFSADDEEFFLLGLSNSSATFWSLADNLKEEDLEVITF